MEPAVVDFMHSWGRHEVRGSSRPWDHTKIECKCKFNLVPAITRSGANYVRLKALSLGI